MNTHPNRSSSFTALFFIALAVITLAIIVNNAGTINLGHFGDLINGAKYAMSLGQ